MFDWLRQTFRALNREQPAPAPAPAPDAKPSDAELETEIAAPTMTGIRQVWHPSVADRLTPVRLAAILRAAADGDADDYLTLAEEMEERDLHYGSVLSTRKLAICGLAVRVDALSDDADDVRRADAVRALVATPEFGEATMHLVDALGKAYAVAELVWDRGGKEWAPIYKPRDPRFFQYDRDDGTTLRLRDEADLTRGIPLPPYKFIVHTPKIRSGLPIRGGLARIAAVAYMCKAWTWRDWMAFADIYGMPLRVGKYGPNASDPDIQKLMAAVANLGSDAAAVMPDSMKIEFEQAAQTTGAGDFFEKLATFWDKQVSKAVLGQTMTADDGASLSQAKVHNEVRLDLLEADAKALSNTLNRMLVRPFCDLNFGGDRYPTLVIQVPKPEDTKLLVDALAKLVPLGLKVEQSVVRDKLGLPDPDDGADLLHAPVQQGATPDSLAAAVNRALNAENTLPRDPPAHMLDPADAAMRPAMTAWLGQIRALVDGAQSLEDIRDGLYRLAPDMSLDEYTAAMQQVLAVASLAGRYDVLREAGGA